MLNTTPIGINPFDFILGGGIAPAISPTTDTGIFSQFLSIMPQGLSENRQSAPLDIGSQSKPSLSDGQGLVSLGMMPLQLPLDLARSLGIDVDPLADSSRSSGSVQSESGQALVSGELLCGKGADGDKLFLKVSTDAAAISPELGNQDDGTILIPVELRTVEQNGNRLIADGFLHQAAGKELPIRVRWELAGSLAGFNRVGSTAEPLFSAGIVPQAAHATDALPRLLENLGVNLMVIETSQKPSPTNPALFLPGSALMPSHRMASNAAGVEIVSDPTQAVPHDGSQVGTVTIDGQFDADMTDAYKDDAGNAKSNDSGKMLSSISRLAPEAPSLPATNAGTEAGGADSANRSSSVRFFDLDQRLGQLKRFPGQTIRIQMVPANLGRMELSIAHNRGLVTVNLAVESEQARQAVEANLTQLENHLTASGIRVDQFQVSVNQPTRQAFFALSEQAYRGQFGRRQDQGHWQNNDPKLMRRFAPPDQEFETVMINCLA
jgi:hypothetical protein